MKFNIAITGELIIIESDEPIPYTRRPIIARSTKSAAPADPWIIRLFLWFVAQFAPLVTSWPPPAWEINRARVDVLVIMIVVLVEVLAQNHVEKALGSMV